MTPIVCFTDGSAIFNGKPNCRASYAVVWPEHPHLNCAEEIPPPASNNRGEFYGAIKAMQIAPTNRNDNDNELYIYTDSKLLIKSMTEWIHKWKKNNWLKADGTPVLNQDLLEIMYDLVQKRKTKFIYVQAHTSNTTFEAENNRLADKLAKQALLK